LQTDDKLQMKSYLYLGPVAILHTLSLEGELLALGEMSGV